MQKYTNVKECRCCKSKNLSTVLDLGSQPLANSYHKGEELDSYPLCLILCNDCSHMQLSVVVDPEELFRHYLYVSGTSKTLNKYFEDFVDIVSEYTDVGTVLEIACNDGTQLDKFKEKGWSTTGVDPAENLHKISSKKHKVICDFWGTEIVKKYGMDIGTGFDVIVAQNVFAHVHDTDDFLKACSMSMHDESWLMIQTSQANMVLNNEFDTTYHEHLSYFNTNSMNECTKRNGLSLVDVRKTDIHGTSYLFIIRKGTYVSDWTDKQINSEKIDGLYEKKTYDLFAENALNIVKNLNLEIGKLKNKGFKIIGYGAAAKGNTLLNFANLDLDYILDDNPMKHNLKTPGMNIDIKSTEYIKGENMEKVAIIVLAWNFYKEIKDRVYKVNNCDPRFYIKYFPEVLLVDNY